MSAETQLRPGEYQKSEEYGQSLRVLRKLGELSLQQCGYEGVERLARDDFHTALEENLKTDPEYREWLDFDPENEFDLDDQGRACDNEGTLLRDMVLTGYYSAQEAALKEEEMSIEVERAEGDLEIINAVDSLKPGELYWVVLMDPKVQLERNKELWESRNYREGMACFQGYFKSPDGRKLRTFTYSVEHSNLTAMRKVQSQFGVVVPEGVDPNRWSRYGVKQTMSAEEAATLGTRFRTAYYKEVGKTHKRISVTEYRKANQPIVDAYFETYIRPLGKAINSERNNTVLQSFARTLLHAPTASELDPEVMQQLRKTANSDHFTDEEGRNLELLIRYALVEELRKGLKDAIHPSSHTSTLRRDISYHSDYQSMPQHVLEQQLVGNISTGVEARRSYGGCTGAKVGTGSSVNENNTLYKQSVSIRASNTREDATSSYETCEYQHNGCYCCPYDNEGRPLGRKITVTARRDKDGTAYCLRSGCGAKLSADGKKATKGDIAKKAEKYRAKILLESMQQDTAIANDEYDGQGQEVQEVIDETMPRKPALASV